MDESSRLGIFETTIIPIVVIAILVIAAVLLVVAAVVLFKVVFGNAPSYGKKDIYSSKNTVPAEIIKKTTCKGESTPGMGINLGGGTSQYVEYYITFKLEDGTQVELKTPQKQFVKLREGDMGNLTYQQNKFINYKTTDKH